MKKTHEETYRGHKIVIWEEEIHPITLSGIPSPNYSIRHHIDIDGVRRENNVGNLGSKPIEDARIMIDLFIENNK